MQRSHYKRVQWTDEFPMSHKESLVSWAFRVARLLRRDLLPARFNFIAWRDLEQCAHCRAVFLNADIHWTPWVSGERKFEVPLCSTCTEKIWPLAKAV